MKKILVVFVALLAMVAFVSGVVAQEKKAEKPAAAADKPKADKPKAPKALKVTGAVAAYEAGKTITVKTKDKELAFDIAADAKVKGEVKEGAKVTVTYKKDGDKMVATAISVAAAKKAKAPTPKAEKK
jgi:branched-subunit amino acid aminotransferase/4-amino-4-deoxychorismate lyase